METQFLSYIIKHLPFIQHKKLLLAVSGGLDSMVLFHLCHTHTMDIGVAHCNFGLRGEESEAETSFVKATMQKAKISCFIRHFDTYAYAKEKKISTQMAARDLRYTWFQDLARTENFEYILTAHHANDTAETFLINLSRGTGIQGLTGIPQQHKNVVRPLLSFSRKQVKEYALANAIAWKEDSSNTTDAYLRNHLRHHAIPALEAAAPHFLDGLLKTQENLKQTAALMGAYVQQLRQEFTYPINSIQGPAGFAIDLEKLATHPAPNAVLYALLEAYGFTAWEDIYGLRAAQSGKQVLSSSHTVFKDRTTLQLMPKTIIQKTPVYWIEASDTEIIAGAIRVQLEEVKSLAISRKNEIFVDKHRLKFPLQLRSWHEGDVFFPFGLGGKKKLSKFFKDEKLSLKEKQEVQLLCSQDQIVWILGLRPDDRFKVTDKTQTIVKIAYEPYEV